jgi:hypothetical protein
MSDELDDYSAVAEEQLDALELADSDTYNDVLTVCELIFSNPGRAQSMSTAVQTPDGIVSRLPVPGHAPLKVFWTPAGPRVEAVFPHP